MSGSAVRPASSVRGLTTAAALLAALHGVAALAAPPAITSTPNLNARVNEPYRYDGDGRAEATGTAPLDWRLVTAPAGMELDNLTGEIFWFPSATGDFPVELACGNAEGEVTQSFTIRVAGPAPPQIDPVQVTQINRGIQLSLQLTASGAQPIVWRLDSAPAGALLDPVTGLLSWLPATTGPATFDFTAANTAGQQSASWTVEVVDPVLPAPSAAFSVTPATGEAPLLSTFDAAASSSNDATQPLLTHRWDFGDGTPSRVGVLPSVVHGYPLPGGYLVRLTVQNVYLRTDSATVQVQATSGGLLPPAARIQADVLAGTAPLQVSFRCDCQPGSQPILSYAWDFGDGQGSILADAAHVFLQPGGYNVKLRVLDQRGLTAQDAVFVSVGQGAMLPPFARARALPVSGDAPLSVQMVSEVGDPDGLVVSRRWTLADGRSADNSDPLWAFDQVGTYKARLDVLDNDGLSSSDTVEILVTRNGVLPPRIVSSPITVGAVGVPYIYGMDGHATARGGLPVTWEVGKAVDGGRVNVPAGMEVDPASGLIRWTPRKDQVGEVRVSITATNAAGSDVQDFTVSVVDRAGFYLIGCSATPGGPLLAALGILSALALARTRRRPRAALASREGGGR